MSRFGSFAAIGPMLTRPRRKKEQSEHPAPLNLRINQKSLPRFPLIGQNLGLEDSQLSYLIVPLAASAGNLSVSHRSALPIPVSFDPAHAFFEFQVRVVMHDDPAV